MALTENEFILFWKSWVLVVRHNTFSVYCCFQSICDISWVFDGDSSYLDFIHDLFMLHLVLEIRLMCMWNGHALGEEFCLLCRIILSSGLLPILIQHNHSYTRNKWEQKHGNSWVAYRTWDNLWKHAVVWHDTWVYSSLWHILMYVGHQSVPQIKTNFSVIWLSGPSWLITWHDCHNLVG